jgi:cation transporter-like permease
MRVDQLHAHPEIIRSSVRLGICHGAAAALASARLRTGVHLGGIDPSFPETSSAAVRRRAMLDFAGFGRVVAAEMDVDDLLRRGMDPELDGP